MEAHLQSLKVPELKALLSKASLAVSGNKADLVKRLLENPSVTEGLLPQDALVDTNPAVKASETPASAPSVPTTESQQTAQPSTGAASPAPASTTTAGAAASSPAPATAEPSAEERKASLIAELEKRKARAARFGQELGEADRKLERAIKFGLEEEDGASLKTLEGELSGKKKQKKEQELKKQDGKKNGEPQKQNQGKKTPVAKEPEKVLTEEEKAALEERKAKEEELKRKRAERFGLVDPVDEEKKRKRADKFAGGETAAEVSSKRRRRLEDVRRKTRRLTDNPPLNVTAGRQEGQGLSRNVYSLSLLSTGSAVEMSHPSSLFVCLLTKAIVVGYTQRDLQPVDRLECLVTAYHSSSLSSSSSLSPMLPFL